MEVAGSNYPIAQIAPILELVNLGLAVVVTSIGFTSAARRRGDLKTVWNMLILAAVAIGVHELMGVIAWTGVMKFSGWFNLLELVATGSLVVAVNSLSKVREK